MAAPVRTAQQRESDLGRTARWYRQGLTAGEIAERIGVTRQQIQYDLAELRRQWMDAQIYNINERKAAELERLDAIEAEAAEAFERSKACRSRTRKRSVKDGTTVSITDHETAGDPRFLQVRLECVAKRCKILNLCGPTEIPATPPNDPYRPLLEGATVEELRVLKRLLERPATADPSANGSGSGSSDAA